MKMTMSILTASTTKTEETAPFHLGSLSGKSWPMSGRPKAPKMASTTQCSSTSPAKKKQIYLRMILSHDVRGSISRNIRAILISVQTLLEKQGSVTDSIIPSE